MIFNPWREATGDTEVTVELTPPDSAVATADRMAAVAGIVPVEGLVSVEAASADGVVAAAVFSDPATSA